MSDKKTTNLAVSVRQRLLNLSRERQEAFNLVLAQYAIERFLFALANLHLSKQPSISTPSARSGEELNGPSSKAVLMEEPYG